MVLVLALFVAAAVAFVGMRLRQTWSRSPVL
jgi:hypothetical protein